MAIMISTDIKYMIDLDWDHETLEKAKKFLIEWDKRDGFYYKNCSKLMRKVDMAEREHYRNCINFWENKLSNLN